MEPDVHPTDIDETAEAYPMGRLTPEESAAFEAHYVKCQQCAERLEAIEEFREALRRAVAKIGEDADAILTTPPEARDTFTAQPAS